MLRSQDRGSRLGLTLLELMVVIAIMVAVAAVLIPLLPDFLTKANQATSATNMAEMEKALMTFRTRYNHSPNHFDSLLTQDGAALTTLIPGPFDGGNCLEVGTLTKGQAGRLFTEGINTVHDLENDLVDREGFHPTKFPYTESHAGVGTGRTLTSQSTDFKVAKLLKTDGSYDGILDGVRLNPEHDYVAFGIGYHCTLCGANGLVKEAPIFFYPKDYKLSSPSNSYLRICAIYDVGKPDDNAAGINARFIACAGITTGGLYHIGDMVDAYIDNEFDMSEPDE